MDSIDYSEDANSLAAKSFALLSNQHESSSSTSMDSCIESVLKAHCANRKESVKELLRVLATAPSLPDFKESSKKLSELSIQGYVPKEYLYLACAARSDFEPLISFSGSDVHFLWDETELCSGLLDPTRNLELDLFLITVKKRCHWFSYFLEIGGRMIALNSSEQVKQLFSRMNLSFLWPFILLHLLHQQHHSLGENLCSVVYHSIKEDKTKPQSLVKLAGDLKWQFQVLAWLQTRDVAATVIPELYTQHMSTLLFLHLSCNLPVLGWSNIHEYLLNGSTDGCCVEAWEVATFDTFWIYMLTLDSVSASLQLQRDNLTDKEYRGQVYERLKEVQQIICQLQPLSLRLEVLENIFSLLFLRFEDFKQESSSESGDEENTNVSARGSGIAANNLSRCEMTSSSLTNVQRATHKNEPATSLSSNTAQFLEEQSRFHLLRIRKNGFVCGCYITRDILSMLQTCLVSTKAACYSSLSNGEPSRLKNMSSSIPLSEVQSRINKLTMHVAEAMWKLEIVTSQEFIKSIGQVESVARNSQNIISSDWMYPHSLDDDSASDDEVLGLKTGPPAKISRRRRSDTEKSSESGSQSNSASASHPSAKWSYRTRRKSMSYSCSGVSNETIIHKMLASKNNLVMHCLARGDVLAAKEVIQVLKMENSIIAAEVAFAEAYHDLQHKLNIRAEECNIKRRDHASLISSQNATLKAIQRAASVGVQTSTLNNEVENLLSKNSLPFISSSKEMPPDLLQLVGGGHDEQKIALAGVDIALILSTNSQQAQNFLGIASKYCQELRNLHSGPPSRAFPVGFLTLAQSLLQYFQGTGHADSASPLELLHRWDLPSFSARCLRDYLPCWETLKAILVELETIKNTTDTATLYSRFLQQPLSQSFFKSDDNKPECHYLQDLKLYLHNFYNVVLGISTSSIGDSPLTDEHLKLLWESPARLLSQVLVQKEISTTGTLLGFESTVLQLGGNLSHVIALELCSSLPSIPPPKLQKSSDNNLGICVLNSEINHGPARYPTGLVQSLLSTLLEELCYQHEHLQRNQKSKCGLIRASVVNLERVQPILNATWELSVVNLNVLSPGAEMLAFYCNLANLMWIHTLLYLHNCDENDISKALTKGSPIEQLSARNLVAYRIGGAGLVTLWEACHLALGKDLVSPHGTSQLCSLAYGTDSQDPLTLFVVSTGINSSPKVKVLQAEHLEAQLQQCVQDYVRHWVCVESGQVIVPSLVQQYIHVTGRNMRTFLMDNSGGSIQDQLDALPEDMVVVQCAEDSTAQYITLSYEGKLLWPRKDANSREPNQNLMFSLSEDISQYLSRNCSLVETLLQAIHKEGLSSESDSEEEPKEATEIHENSFLVGPPSFEKFPCLARICSSSETTTLCHMFENNPVLCALHSFLPSNLLWDCFDCLIKDRKWETIVDILDALPEPQLRRDRLLQQLRDMVLLELTRESRDCLNPWQYCEQISSVCLRVRCILAEVMFWPGHIGVAQLHNVLRTPCLIALPDMYKKALHQMHSISIYQKVIDQNEMGQWNSWYEVHKSSQTNPDAVLDCILEMNNAEICLSWMKLHSVAVACPQLIDSRVVVLLLDGGLHTLQAAQEILKSMPAAKASVICNEAMHRVHTLAALRTCLNFLLNESKLSDEGRETLKHVAIGLKMVGVVSQTDQLDCMDLLSSPHLMLEQLIMNMRLETAEQMLNHVRADLMELSPKSPLSVVAVDAMVRQYAGKALDFRVSQASPTGPLSDENTFLASMSSQSQSQSGSKEFVMPHVAPCKADWVPNDQAAICMHCQVATFSMFVRRHHCRRCGRVVCAPCSARKMIVTGYGTLKVRVCDGCLLQSRQQSEIELTPSNDRTTMSLTSDGSIAPENFWRLTKSASFNETVRGEFAYEHAPSVSLCLSILKLHSQHAACPAFLVDSCDTILSYLQANNGVSNPEIDHPLVIDMCRSLVLAAKLKCAQWGYVSEEPNCDQRLSKIDLLSLLVSHGCSALLPNETSTHGLRRLRNQLLEEELWELALEVSTKAGLERNGVWAAWGKGCLRAGRWNEARERFAQCLPNINKAKRSSGDSPLLIEILQILENTPHAMDREVIEKAEVLRSSSLSFAPAPALAVLHSLASLKDISDGKFSHTKRSPGHLEPLVYAECCYYLREYASHASYLQFLVRHADLSIALQHTLSNNLDPHLFFEWVYMPCLRLGQITPLHRAMTFIDSSLVKWKAYLHGVCAALEKRKLLHTLYEVQQWSKDHVRAAMTCIRFYHLNAKSYIDLASNINHLMRAQTHLEAGHAVASVSFKVKQAEIARGDKISSDSDGPETMWLKLTPKDLDHHLSTVWRQIELTKFLSKCEAGGWSITQAAHWFPHAFAEPLASGLPSLFSNTSERKLLAGFAIFCGKNVEEGYGIAFRIIEGFNLKPQEIYENVAIALLRSGRISEIPQLLSCIRSSGISNPDNVCDCVLSASIGHLPEQPNPNEIDLLVRSISENTLKIKAYISCKQLKSAYLLAVKHQRLEDIELILSEAERLGQVAIRQICLKRLGRL